MRVKEPVCLDYTIASTTTDSGTTGLLDFTFTSVNSLSVKLDIILSHCSHRTEVSGLDFKDLSNYTNIITSLSNTQSWRWGLCSQHSFWREEIDNVDFLFFLKINLFYSLYSSPVIYIHTSKRSIITINSRISVILGVCMSWSSSYQSVWDENHINTINWEGAAAANQLVWFHYHLKQFFRRYQGALTAPQLINQLSSSELQELTQDCAVAPWHRLSFDHQLDLHRGLLDRVEDGHTYGFLHPRAENRRCCNQITPEEHNWKWSVTATRALPSFVRHFLCSKRKRTNNPWCICPCRVIFVVTNSLSVYLMYKYNLMYNYLSLYLMYLIV